MEYIEYILQSKCAVGSPSPPICEISTDVSSFTPTSSYKLNDITTIAISASITNMNITKPTSRNLIRSEVTSAVHIRYSSNGHKLRSTTLNIVICPTITPQDTSNNIIVIITIVVVFVLLILLILPITTIIIIVVVIIKKKTNNDK